MADYNAIYQQMEPGKEYTARELGVAAASMTAMVRRGLVVVSRDTSPKLYRKNSDNPAGWVYATVAANLPADKEFFTIYKQNRPIGMLCSIKNKLIVDCYDQPYALDDVVSIEIYNRKFDFS